MFHEIKSVTKLTGLRCTRYKYLRLNKFNLVTRVEMLIMRKGLGNPTIHDMFWSTEWSLVYRMVPSRMIPSPSPSLQRGCHIITTTHLILVGTDKDLSWLWNPDQLRNCYLQSIVSLPEWMTGINRARVMVHVSGWFNRSWSTDRRQMEAPACHPIPSIIIDHYKLENLLWSNLFGVNAAAYARI